MFFFSLLCVANRQYLASWEWWTGASGRSLHRAFQVDPGRVHQETVLQEKATSRGVGYRGAHLRGQGAYSNE